MHLAQHVVIWALFGLNEPRFIGSEAEMRPSVQFSKQESRTCGDK